jgi:hypothetical protein
VLHCVGADATVGIDTPLTMRVTLYDEALTKAGLTLTDMAAAFDRDVRTAAVAVMQARPHDATDLVLSCRGCRKPVSPRGANRLAG